MGIETTVDACYQDTAHRDLDYLNRAILDCAGEGIYGLDLAGVTTFANPAAARMVGWSLDRQGDGTATVRFVVTDTGIGIRPDQVAALFTAFSQADPSATRKYGGAGLGLAICKHLVETMGGTMGVENREGPGCAFWFTAVFGLGYRAATAKEAHGASGRQFR
jgi:signal transduction histidine kinase